MDRPQRNYTRIQYIDQNFSILCNYIMALSWPLGPYLVPQNYAHFVIPFVA